MFNREFSSHMDRAFRQYTCVRQQVAYVSTRKEREKNKWCECRIKVTPVRWIIRTNYLLSTASLIYIFSYCKKRTYVFESNEGHVDEIIHFSDYFLFKCETHVSNWRTDTSIRCRLFKNKKNMLLLTIRCLITSITRYSNMIFNMALSLDDTVYELIESVSIIDFYWMILKTNGHLVHDNLWVFVYILRRKKSRLSFSFFFTNTIITHT